MGRSKGSLIERFWSFVVKSDDDCWSWTGTKCTKGYGLISVGHKGQIKAHRLSWEINYGPIPEGLCVLHRCDVRDCTRPDHLFLGTKSDNSLDMFAKGRNVTQPGSLNGNAKLTEDDIPRIRYDRMAGYTYAEIGRKFGVTGHMIRRIIVGIAWRQVEGGTQNSL